MRTIKELTSEELNELREAYFYEFEDVLGDIDEPDKVPLSNVISHYEGVYFVEEDFWCNLNQ